MCGVLFQGLPVLQTNRVSRRGCPALWKPLHRDREANEKVQGSETLLILLQSRGGRGLLFQVAQSSRTFILIQSSSMLCKVWFFLCAFVFSCAGILCRKLVVPQKEASPFLNKKIDELEVKLADIDDEDMEDMDEEETPETASMPQMQTPLSSDMDNMPYLPSQVPINQ